jgi:GNAT superfamily N-acetyltransferase
LLVGMFVEPVERGRGLGAALVAAVVAWARARGATSLYLWVTATNDSAIALYDKCGFRRTGNQRPVAHSPSLAEIRMVRDLC